MKRRASLKNIFKKVKLLVLDFDGVITDDRVYIDERGKEFVCCSRSDGLGIELIKKKGVEVVVISQEKNAIVRNRCKKLNITCFYGINNKMGILQKIIHEYNIPFSCICYLGNDITDIDCVKLVGVGCAVLNAHPSLIKVAKYVTRKEGGGGAVREICDLILGRLNI